MKFYLNNLTNIDLEWFQDERIKKDDSGDYLENMEDYEWYKEFNWAIEILEGHNNSVNIATYLEDKHCINEWSDYIYYGKILEDVVKKGDESWLLAYIEVTDEIIEDALDTYEKNSYYIGYDMMELEEICEKEEYNVEKTEYGYIAIKVVMI